MFIYIYGVPLWLGGLKIWCCHSCGSGYSCGIGSIPGPGTSACSRQGQKKQKQTNKKTESLCCTPETNAIL